MGEALRLHSRWALKVCRSEPLFCRAQVLAPAKRTEALFHRSQQTERTSPRRLCHSTDATEFMTQLIAEAETAFSKCWDAVSGLRETRDEDDA